MNHITANPHLARAFVSRLFISLFSLFLLAACGGSGGGSADGGTDPVVIGANMVMTVSNAQNEQPGEFEITSTIKVSVLVKNDFGRAVSGVTVTFTSSKGTLTPAATITDGSGRATIDLVTTDIDLGLVSLAATATVDGKELTAAKNIAVTVQNTQSNSLTLEVLEQTCTTPVTTVKAGVVLCLKAVLSLDGAGVEDQIVSFAAPIGSIRQGTVLTDADGIAITFIDSIESDVGAATATASVGTATTSQNYQLTQPQGTSSPTISMVILDSSCTFELNRAAAGTTFCLQASLSENDAPIASALINFSVNLGTLQQNSALTNSAGVASVLLTSTNILLGGATATASFQQFQATQDYEFTNGVPQDNTVIELFVFDMTCTNQTVSVSAGSTLCLRVTLIRDNSPLPGEIVEFTSTSGTLRQDSALTDANGDVTVFLDSTTDELGAGVISAIWGPFSDFKNYEYTDGTPQGTGTTISLAILDSSCQQPVISATAGTTLCLQTNLTKDNQPQIGAIVEFDSTLGTLRQTSALTNSIGVASVFLDSTTDLLDAGTVTATFGQFSDAQNFEYTAGSSQGPTAVSLSIFDSSCQTPVTSTTAGLTLCLQAILVNGTSPVPGEVIAFAAPIGTLRQTTALTNSAGIATAFIDSLDTVLGAATVNVSFATLSDSANYEFVSDNSQPAPEPVIELTTVQDQQFSNRFRVGDDLQIQATLSDGEGNPLANSIVRFTAERGQLATNSALTDNSGLAQVTLSAVAADVGAAVTTASAIVNGVTYTQAFNYEILASDAVELEAARIGYFNEQGVFVNQQMGTTLIPDENGALNLSAGGTMGVNIAVVDPEGNRIITPTPVSFTSACFGELTASLDAQVTTVNGEARSTYQDLSCATVNGNQDTIVASITVNNSELSASINFNLLAEGVGSIEFISADPTELVLQGTGGQGKKETSTLTYMVRGVLGNPLAQQTVNFSLDTEVGGLSLNPESSLTNSQGLVTTRVTSGTVPTAVRVTASTEVNGGNTIRTQSDLLSINTGLPDQNSFTLSTAVTNPEAHSFSGAVVPITAFLSDSFNNPVPDGTTVNFTTEGGNIDANCNTINGSCNVNWRATEPRVPNHRITVMAYAIGHETFFDTNGNNVFDDADTQIKGAISDGSDSGLDRSTFHEGGFIDHENAWRDDNENRIFDGSDVPFDFNANGQHDAADGLFNGPNCTHSALCGGDGARSLFIRKSLVMIMSSSNVVYTLVADELASPSATNQSLTYLNQRHVLATNDTENGVELDGLVRVTTVGTVVLPGDPNIPDNDNNQLLIDEGLSLPMTLYIADDALGLGQTLPVGTTVSITTSIGRTNGQDSATINNTVGYVNRTGDDQYGGTAISFNLENIFFNNTGDEGLLNFSFTFTPSQSTFSFSVPVRMF